MNEKGSIERDLVLGVFNLHDVFLNATVQRAHMSTSPIEPDPRVFDATDRLRFERCWITFLYVLVEAWKSPDMKPTVEFVSAVTPTEELQDLLAEGERIGCLEAMRETRHYMCHRDKRGYWDYGRRAYYGGDKVEYAHRLHEGFGEVLLAAVRAVGG